MPALNIRDRARRLLGRERRHENTVATNRVEQSVLNDLSRRSSAVASRLDAAPVIPATDDDPARALDGNVWRRLGEDIWSEFYGLDEPTVRGRDKVADSVKVNRELADKTAHSDRYRELHGKTRGEVTESALAWLSAMDSLGDSYGEELAEHGQLANDAARTEAEIDRIDDDLAALRTQRSTEKSEGGVNEIDEQIRNAAKQKRAAVDGLARIEASQGAIAGDLIDAGRSAAAKANAQAAETVEVASLVPGAQRGAGASVSTEAMLAFADRVHGSSVLRDVLAMLGRLELSMGSARRQLRKGGWDEMVDIETGDDLRLVLPQERALLAHPVARLDFYRRYHERSLMQFEMWSMEETKKGPLIFCTDGSGSMAGAKNVFARGLTLAACSIANRERRNAAAIEFGSDGELRSFIFPAGEALDLSAALDFAEHFYGGGTDINQCLRIAGQMISEEAPFETADLVLVTDGGDILTDESRCLSTSLRNMGVRIHGLAIGMESTPYLTEVCDTVNSVFDFTGTGPTSNRLAIDIS